MARRAARRNDSQKNVPPYRAPRCRHWLPDVRVTNNMEVNSGLSREQAVTEATRCLDCPTPPVWKAAPA